jgi:Ala-tRNA(Pro) deacylase
VAKTVLARARDAYLLVVLPATARVDLSRLGQALGLDPGEVKLATAEEIERIFHDCEPGTIPPFGRLYGLGTVVDASLEGAGVLVFRTNTRHLGLRMQFRDYECLEQPFRADFARPINSGTRQSSPRNPQRCAG